MTQTSDVKAPTRIEHRRLAGDWQPSQLRRLIGGKVLIERDAAPERVRPDSPVIVPELSRGAAMEAQRVATGRIVSMGPGMKVGKSKKWKGGSDYRWPMPDVPIGARVVYRTWAVRAEFERGGKHYDLVSDEVVDVVIEPVMSVGETVVMSNFRPLFDRILVKRLEPADKTAGGIIIPDSAKEKQIEGEVLAIGRGRIEPDGTIRPLDMGVGERVLFGKHSGTDIIVEGIECLILREDDILGIVDPLPVAGAAE